MGIDDSLGFENHIYWALVFERALSEINISDATLCLVAGLVVRRDVACKETRDPAALTESSLESVEKRRQGINCDLGELVNGLVHAILLVAADTGGNSRIYCKLCLDDIDFNSLPDWLRRRQQEISDGKWPDSNVVSLAEYVQSTQSIDSRQLKYKAALAAARGVRLDDIPLSHVNKAIAAEIQRVGRSLPRGTGAVISLVDGSGVIVCEQRI